MTHATRTATVEQLRREINTASQALLVNEPAEIYAIRTGNHKVRAGGGGQFFTTWDTAHGMLRDWACQGLYPLLRLAEDSETGITPMQLLEIWRATGVKYSTYLGYSGFDTLHNFERRAYAACLEQPERDVIVSLVRELVRYANLLTAWSHHYFPWGIGKGMRYDETFRVQAEVDGPQLGRSTTAEGRSVEGPRIEIIWEPMGVSVVAVLAASLNPELADEFASALPFTILQEHALVSGESMFAWTPLVSTAPIQHSERISEAPIGRLRFSQNSGQKFIVQYGATTEDLVAPVLGQIAPEDCGQLLGVGNAVWRNTLEREEDIWVSVKLA